jgi:thioredoxin
MMELLTLETFKQKIFDFEVSTEWAFKGTRPAIIDFYADWCGPCKRLSPVLEELQKEYGEKLDIYKINVDSEQDIASAFGIMSVPTILFIPVQGEPQMAQGALPKDVLDQAINDVLFGCGDNNSQCCGGGCNKA